VHHKPLDGSRFPIEECPLTRCQGGEPFHVEDDWWVRSDGSMVAIAYKAVPILPVDLEIADVQLPPPIEASVYFFCSEALNNVAKHARADSAWVRIALSGDALTVEVGDDGAGGAQTRSGGSGLIGLHDRIGALDGALDGALEVDRPAPGGTVLRARIPVTPGSRAGDAALSV
jgi:signal transduction histidine kinase